MLHEVKFPSFNERDTVYGWIYVPAAKPKGIIQIVHGYGEHSRRYLHMIVRFLEAGFIVAADDHVGHGKTAIENDTWGDWGDKGCHTMMEDEHSLQKLAQEKYPDLPYFMYGHSMGSFIARDYAAKYGDELSGLIICGTAGKFPGIDESEKELLKAIDEGKGDDSDPNYSVNLLGWMCERCGEIKYGNEWICADPYVQKDHAEDPFDAFTKPVKNRALLYFVQMIQVIGGEEWAKKVPTALPIYNIAGGEDPVGLYGKGVCEVSNWLNNTGHNVTTKLYSGYRHEIHNYADLKNEVEDGIISFMEQQLG
jgi:alpha-beta hydrolase superfamily lysophospholipase